MRRIDRIDERTTCVIESVGTDIWTVSVDAHVQVVCERGVQHHFPVSCTIEITQQIAHEDLALLDAFEWGLRGDARSLRKLSSLIIDDQMFDSYVDPCEVQR